MEQNLLVEALVYLAAAVIAVPIAKRCGVGAVLGYLLAGIAIGPWGFGVISAVEDMLHFSEFGVVLLLFLIGLELEPKRLWLLRRSIFGWGGMQVVGVAAALFATGVAFGIAWPVALIAALGLSLSSTAVALATLQERNLLGTAAGAAGFAILLFQDIAAIPMIAVVPMLGDGGQAAHGPGWLKAVQVFAVIAALVASSRFLLRPLLRIIAKTDTREIFTAFALLLVIAIGLLMESVGMSMALGTFLAGVLLADSEYRHALESDLEPFKGLLLGLFFIAVGMSIDFGIFLSHPLTILGILLGFLVIKMVVLYGLSKTFTIPLGEQAFFAFILSQGGEFAFVVFGAAEKANVFSKETSSVLVAVVALSMMITPLLLVLHDKFIEPRFANGGKKRPDDKIGPQHNEVIVAGFGRIGQIVVRLLRASRIGVTVLDHDIDQVELLRKFGFKVFYGNPARIDLLASAGAREAKVMVVAIDDAEESLNVVRNVKESFPHLKIVARARNVTHYYDLMDLGVHVIERETFDSALRLGDDVLRELGFGAYQARKVTMKFRAHNIKSLLAVYPHHKDQQKMISLAAQARQELEEMFARDAEAVENERSSGGWN
jgi:glutathione-regulated potassium-efflux system ancillary protein KefC